jgi:predicted AlkP superfamily pyrophosphatase or phosphodiesterase
MRFVFLLLMTVSIYGQRVMVIGIDGLSTAAFDKAQMPNLKAMMSRGAYTLKARGVLPTVSSPNWGSILMGAGPEQHGVTSNEWQRDKFEIEPSCKGPEGIYPNVFGVLKAAKPKLHLAAIYDWDGFGRLFDRSAAAHAVHVLKSEETAKSAIEYWNTKKPDFLFVHLDDVDHAGHEHAWESAKYFEEAGRIDGLVGKLVEAASGALVIVVSDHGGTGKKHGNANMNDLQIPVILAGPKVKQGEFRTAVNIYDLAPTITAAFRVAGDACWIGKSLLNR